jgi:CheY-like chemotaxis protein
METGNLRLEKINFSPAEVIWEVFNAMNLKAGEKNILLECDVENIKDLFLEGDPLRLKQVLFNLIGNAIKFTENGEVIIKCRIENSISTLGSPFLIFSISDTGIGIPEEKLKTIFSQFSQADSSISRKFGGSGLGLSISKKIIEMQGGTIEVKSKVLKGSEFIFSIPYEMSGEGRGSRTEIKLMQSEFLNADPESFKPLSGIKILLAEDVEINRALQIAMLKDLGATVTEASDGYEVISELRAHNFELILMDIQMPGMSGIETIKEIRTKLNLEIPALAMTANVMQKDLEHYLQAGFNDCITKPFKERELAEKILKLLNKKFPNFNEIKNEEQKIYDGAVLYNLQELREASNGNDEFVARMIKIFIRSSEDSLSNMKVKIAAKEFDKIHIYAHKMIPSYNHFNIYDAVEELYILEKNGDELLVSNEIIKRYEHLKTISEKVFALLKSEIELLERIKMPVIGR